MREALQQLQNEGLVVMAPNRGAWIADVNSEESIEVYKIREVVEPLAIFESVPNMTNADIASLDATVRELETVTTVEDYIQLDRQFHLRTYARAQNAANAVDDRTVLEHARSTSGGSSSRNLRQGRACRSPIRSISC